MADRIGVKNMALGHLAAGTIIDEEEETIEAQALSIYWDTARRCTLARQNWGFARKRKKLSKIVQVTDGRIDWFRYQWPTDCVAFRAIVRATDEDPFIVSRRPSYGNKPIPYERDYDAVNGRTIITPLDNAYGMITFDLKNIDEWSEEAALSLSFILASLSAMSITKSDNDVKRCLQLFNSSFDIAATTDANEGDQYEEEEGELERSRY